MTFKPKKIWTYSATQNDCLNLSFVKDMIVVDKMPRHREKWPIKANFVQQPLFCHIFCEFSCPKVDSTCNSYWVG